MCDKSIKDRPDKSVYGFPNITSLSCTAGRFCSEICQWRKRPYRTHTHTHISAYHAKQPCEMRMISYPWHITFYVWAVACIYFMAGLCSMCVSCNWNMPEQCSYAIVGYYSQQINCKLHTLPVFVHAHRFGKRFAIAKNSHISSARIKTEFNVYKGIETRFGKFLANFPN